MTETLHPKERKILIEHTIPMRRSRDRRDWTIYVDLQRRGLLTLTLDRMGSSMFRVHTTEAGHRALGAA